ncbi:hypothetical protein Peur_026499 [Populus x canadensis]
MNKEFSGATIHHLEEINKQEPQGGFEDEENPYKELPQLTMSALEDGLPEFVRRLAEEEELNNWKIQEVSIIFKK